MHIPRQDMQITKTNEQKKHKTNIKQSKTKQNKQTKNYQTKKKQFTLGILKRTNNFVSGKYRRHWNSEIWSLLVQNNYESPFLQLLK